MSERATRTDYADRLERAFRWLADLTDGCMGAGWCRAERNRTTPRQLKNTWTTRGWFPRSSGQRSGSRFA